jgi:hypothetical protein
VLSGARNTVRAVRETVRTNAQLAIAFNPDHTTERVLSGKAVETKFHSTSLSRLQVITSP